MLVILGPDALAVVVKVAPSGEGGGQPNIGNSFDACP